MVPNKLGLGSIIWWSLPDDIGIKRSEWAPRFPDYPMSAEPLGDPLRRALYALQAPAGSKRLVRPLRQKDHWAVVIETPSTDDLSYKTEFTVKLEADAIQFVKSSGNTSWEFMLQQNYLDEIDRVTSNAVADLILNHVRGQCLAVQARKTGGVYFVPADKDLELGGITLLVEALGGRLFNFPVDDREKHRDDLLHLIVEDLKNARDNVEMNLAARLKNDAIKEGKLAIDRVRFYRDGLGILTEEAGKIEKQINKMMVDALTKKEKKGGK
jgi:hypothetical protein